MSKQGYFPSVDHFAAALAKRVITWRWWVLGCGVLLALLVGSGGSGLEFASNYRVFFSDENPELTAFEDLQATYTKSDNFLFVLAPTGGEVFTSQTLNAVAELTEQAWLLPHAIRVDSITNFQHTSAVEDDIAVEDLVPDAQNLTAAELERIAGIAQSEPLLRQQLVTADGRATAVNVVLQYPQKSLTEVPEAAAAARALQAQIQAEYPHLQVSLTGVSMLNNAFSEAGQNDLATLVPIMFAVIALLTLIILRMVSGTLATLLVILFSAVAGMGMAGFWGVKLTPISASAPIVILTLAIADSIHILLSLRDALIEGRSKREAIIEAIRINFLPVSITSLTTIVGFLALNFSDSPPFWHLGNITAVGIAAAWLYSVTFLPALMSLLPLRPPRRTSRALATRVMPALASFVVRRTRVLVPVIAIAVAVLIAFIPTIEFDDQWVEYFDQRIEFRNQTDAAVEHFGLYPVEFSVPAQGPGGISEPAYLFKLDEFANFLRLQPQVVHVYSLTDVMKRLNLNMHGDDPAWYRIPEERDLSAQYLLLYEMSLPKGLDINDRINIDKSATRITVTLDQISTAATKRFLAASEAWMQTNLPAYMQAIPTGPQVMFTYVTDRNVRQMIAGTIFAIILIAMIMVLALGDIRLGLLSLVPNGLPILTTFGAWGLLVGTVGFSVATVASISLGIIVDDTVHFLSKYTRGRRLRGLNVEQAIAAAFSGVGIPIIVNTVILTVGFLVLTTSAFKLNVDMGLLTALAIVFALILDFLFLPALLVLFDRRSTSAASVALRPGAAKSTVGLALLVLAGGLVLPAAFTPALAQDAAVTAVRGDTPNQRKGFEIAARSDRSDRGFGDSEVDLTMVLRNAAGAESERRLRIQTLEVADERVGDKSLVVFDTPRDVSGTALLSHAKILEADDQWLYLPALKRVKRISSSNKSGPFVGSEFAFEDFTSLELNKYDYNWLRTEACGSEQCDVIERFPRYENSGYSRQLAWVDQRIDQIRKVEFYDRRGDLLKTLVLEDYRDYAGIWRAQRLSMVNHQTGKTTDLIYDDYRFGAGLREQDFVKGRLSRLQ